MPKILEKAIQAHKVRGLDQQSWQRSSTKVLGVRIDLVDYDTTVTLMKGCISQNLLGRYICACPVHPIMLSQRDQELKEALNSAWFTVPDGMPVVWAARCLGASIRNSVRGTNLMLRACKMAESNGHSIFLYGGKPQTLQKLKRNLLKNFPNLQISGIYSPPFRTLSLEEEANIVEMINLASPNFLFVCLGAPKQEKWMLNNCGKIKVPVTMGVGAAFDFLAGEKKQAPQWMRVIGLEWLFRLLSEPKRLWFRYIIYNPLFVLLFLFQLIGVELTSRRR